ncbi:hydroxyethylthiazole kinase [Legionella fairfieldensis]|uniref:hydroxyethylthiazole kinase n=1 Tax=Legionella fairfieldensis TaxID=45064 RepID=UPI00048A9CFD|nr:hydroxyethylthiazole kinase [Legionella fairfieldensis]
MAEKTQEILIRIRQEKPAILNITNYYATYLIASGLRSINAFPILSNAEQEIEELLTLAQSVVINLGKLDDCFINLCNRICQIANKVNKPIILDPVGAGASCYRTNTAVHLIKNHNIAIIRAYPNEIAGLLNRPLSRDHNNKVEHEAAIEQATLLSKKYNVAVVMSGRIHAVIDANQLAQFNFDSSLLQKVAGIASLLSSIIGAFHAMEEERFLAASSAVEFYANCAGPATSRATGPASFKTELIDRLYINSSEVRNW